LLYDTKNNNAQFNGTKNTQHNATQQNDTKQNEAKNEIQK
jgi:hypothetical protein